MVSLQALFIYFQFVPAPFFVRAVQLQPGFQYLLVVASKQDPDIFPLISMLEESRFDTEFRAARGGRVVVCALLLCYNYSVAFATCSTSGSDPTNRTWR